MRGFRLVVEKNDLGYPSSSMKLFEQLNPPQREAVDTLEGPLLVLAGAGSGKTRVVTYRIINLIENQVPPAAILGLTFTNKAAAEMKERIQALTRNYVLIATFHSLGARILRESIVSLGYTRDFHIYDEDDVDKVIKAAMQEALVTNEKLEPKIYRQKISKAKNNLQDPDSVSGRDDPFFPQVYRIYERKMKEYNALDFDDLLFLPVKLFKEQPFLLQMYQDRWQYLLIDEYQDTNQAQYKFVELLVSKRGNICVVGDPDQSIYSWRGANIRNILDFEKDYPGAKVVRLEQNYRSRGNILEAANAVIQNNSARYEKELWSDKGPGEKIKHFTADSDRGEAEYVAERIRHHHDNDNIPLTQMVVFYRTNSQSRVFEDCLLQRRIPYVIVGGISFYQRREVKDILAFLRMVQSGNDFVSFLRTINIPKRGFGETTIEKIRQAASQTNQSVLAYCEGLVDEKHLDVGVKLTAKQKEGLKNYVSLIRELRQVHATSPLSKLVSTAIEKSGYLSYLGEDPDSMDDRKGNLDSLIGKAIEWELGREENPEQSNLSAFLEELSLRSTLDEAAAEKKEHIHLMTIHNGKGLEFEVTFLVGLEEELFPHINSRKEENGDGLEEERRLFYVGMTRAKEYLYLTDVRSRVIWGVQRSQRPSRFLREVPPEFVEKVRRGFELGRSDYVRPPPYKRPAPVPNVYNEPFADELQAPVNGSNFNEGDAVFHKEFGTGIIQQIYQGSLGLTYKVLFSKDNKEKTLIAQYARLLKI